MSLFRKVETTFWGLPLSPDAQRVGLYLITGPCTTRVPGLLKIGRAALAEELGLTDEAARAALGELEDIGQIRADWKARLVWRPEAILLHPPSNPNMVLGWCWEWSQLPRCALLEEAREAFARVLAMRGADYVEAFERVLCGDAARDARERTTTEGNNRFGNGSANGWPNGSEDRSANGSGNGSTNGSGNKDQGSRTEVQGEEEGPERATRADRSGVGVAARPAAPAAPTEEATRQARRAVEAWGSACAPLPTPVLDDVLIGGVARAVAVDPRRAAPAWWADVARAVALDTYARQARWTLRDVLRVDGRLEEYAERAATVRVEQARRAAPEPPRAPLDRDAADRARREASAVVLGPRPPRVVPRGDTTIVYDSPPRGAG